MQINKYPNFWNYYIKNISPRLEQIDILLKTQSCNISKKTVSILLDISEYDIETIMFNKNIKYITSENFFSIMLSGKSYICNILKKEFKKSPKKKYTAEDISYIYNIDYNKIKNAFNFLNIKTIPSDSIKAIFIQIPL